MTQLFRATRRGVLSAGLLCAGGAGAFGQVDIRPPYAPTVAAPAAVAFRAEELEQLAAPIALYPDALVSQVLMAATYPIEIVQADRWARQNPGLRDDALAAALEQQPWDPSVKSLVNFPQVLAMMSDKLDWTTKLGDAFIAQQADVMNAVQRLRLKAQAQGNLKTTREQTVIVEQPGPASVVVQGGVTQIIRIEPVNPQIVYVPVYDPVVVYGRWAYPAFPPLVYYPPGYVRGTVFAFGVGVNIGAPWGYAWGGFRWGRGEIDIDFNRHININHHINRDFYRVSMEHRSPTHPDVFHHDPVHRGGVSYRDPVIAQRYNRISANEAARAREPFRGRPEPIHMGGGNPPPRTEIRMPPPPPVRSNAFEGVRNNGRSVREESERGAASRRVPVPARPAPGDPHGGDGHRR